MANKNQIIAAGVCVLVLAAMISYSNKEDRRPPNTMEEFGDSPRVKVNKKYMELVRKLDLSIKNNVAALGTTKLLLEQHSKPGKKLLAHVEELQVEASTMAAEFDHVFTLVGTFWDGTTYNARRAEIDTKLKKLLSDNGKLVHGLGAIHEPTLASVTNQQQQIHIDRRTVNLNSKVMNNTQNKYNQQSADVMNLDGGEPLKTITAGLSANDRIQGDPAQTKLVETAKDRESASSGAMDSVTLETNAAPEVPKDKAVSQAGGSAKAQKESGSLLPPPPAKKRKGVSAILVPDNVGAAGFAAVAEDGDTTPMLDLTGRGAETPLLNLTGVRSPKRTKRTATGQLVDVLAVELADAQFAKFKRMVRADIAAGRRPAGPPPDDSRAAEWFAKEMANASKGAGDKRERNDRRRR